MSRTPHCPFRHRPSAASAALVVALAGVGCARPPRASAARAVTPAAGVPVTVDLPALAARGGLRAVNRAAQPFVEGARRGVRLDARPGPGAAWLAGAEFGDGVLELDVRGRDVFQGSFVGVAFHAADDSTYEAVYLRPFNFRAADSTRRAHAVQYIALPGHDWPRLRQERPGAYEQPVVPAPAPDGWTHLRVVVASPWVRVYVSDGAEPDLAIEQLGARTRGRVGLWVGDSSPGDFANLRVTPAP